MPKKNPPEHKPYQPVDAAFLRGLPTVMGDSREQTHSASPAPQPLPGEPQRVVPIRLVDTTPAQDEGGPKVPGNRGAAVPAGEGEELAIEPLDQPVKFRVSRSEANELRRLAADLGKQLCTTVDIANLGRAFLLLLRQAEHEIKQQARRNGPLKRPKNDNMAALAEFDHRIAQILFDAFRKALPLR